MAGPERLLDKSARQHWRHGPIELVIDVRGEARAVAAAHDAAWRRFGTVLGELVDELHLLRRPIEDARQARGMVARRMVAACEPYLPEFITPMAAVAGAVAEEILRHYEGPGIGRASVNNGGDIALFLAAGESLAVGLVPDIERPGIDATLRVAHGDAIRGVATSGWRGRSFSLGIADSVTVLARSAAMADAAATMIANAVDADHPAVRRAPAASLRDDTDLGMRPVTVAVGELPPAVVEAALDRGARAAEGMRSRGLVVGAALALKGRWRTIGDGFPRSERSGVEELAVAT